MKHVISFALAAIVAVSVFAGCAGNATLALISPEGDQLGTFGGDSWEGVVKYAEENGISKAYYAPDDSDDPAQSQKSVDTAVSHKAQFVVLPGYQFAQTAYDSQIEYPEVKFVLIDTMPTGADGAQAVAANTAVVMYNEAHAGFMAGYAAVYEGYTRLGFIGGEQSPSVTRFGYGFLQGAEYAATERSMPAGSITVNYCYSGTYEISDAVTQLAQQWYEGGTQCIFAAAGNAGASVMQAAEDTGGKVIGCDIDQSELSVSVITSAEKCMDVSVYNILADYYGGTFPGGQVLTMDATNGGVALAMDNARFTSFTQEQYDDLLARLMSNTANITVNIKADTDASGAAIELSQLGLSAVSVQQVSL